jgi:hypothetical protein
MKKCFSDVLCCHKSLSYAAYVRASRELITQLRSNPAETNQFDVTVTRSNCLSFATLLKSMRCHQLLKKSAKHLSPCIRVSASRYGRCSVSRLRNRIRTSPRAFSHGIAESTSCSVMRMAWKNAWVASSAPRLARPIAFTSKRPKTLTRIAFRPAIAMPRLIILTIRDAFFAVIALRLVQLMQSRTVTTSNSRLPISTP